jgi:hypothetical protein
MVNTMISGTSRVQIRFNPCPTISLLKPAKGRTKEEMRLFQIKTVRIHFDSMLDETIAELADSTDPAKDKLELIQNHVAYNGSWALKSGGWADASERIEIPFSMLSQQTLSTIHAAVGYGLDKYLEDVKRMYTNYSGLVNAGLSK